MTQIQKAANILEACNVDYDIINSSCIQLHVNDESYADELYDTNEDLAILQWLKLASMTGYVLLDLKA